MDTSAVDSKTSQAKLVKICEGFVLEVSHESGQPPVVLLKGHSCDKRIKFKFNDLRQDTRGIKKGVDFVLEGLEEGGEEGVLTILGEKYAGKIEYK